MLDEDIIKLSETYISPPYIQRSLDRFRRTKKKLANVMSEGRLPDEGFSEEDIQAFLFELGRLDSNNWDHSVGVGEREGRVLLNFVRARHYGLTHGIGRSGDVTAIQPKAPGSSIINRLTNQLLLDWLRRSGSPSTASCFLVPMATGMSLTLCLLAMKRCRPPEACFVLWPRIDQKSCFKCILAAGLIPIPIELQEGKLDPYCPDESKDQLCCSIDSIREALKWPAMYLYKHWPDAAIMEGITDTNKDTYGPNHIVCVLSTTTCFAPRVPDRLHAITKECITYGVSHLINNAYGVQSVRCMRMIESAGLLLLQNRATNQASEMGSQNSGRPCSFDLPINLLYVQSTDKNLMVPVGGAIIAGFSSVLVESVAKMYPGRASATPSIDVLSTLLHLGYNGWHDMLEKRDFCFERLRKGLQALAVKYGLQLMQTSANPISLALNLEGLLGPYTTVDNLSLDQLNSDIKSKLPQIVQVGARLFSQGCSGVRVILPALGQDSTKLGNYAFPGFNSHSSKSTKPYLNAAAAIGQSQYEVDTFITRLDKVLNHFKRTLADNSEENKL